MVEQTLNLKLLKLALATLARYGKRIEASAALRERCEAVKLACGAANSGQLLIDTAERPAGGLALGPDRCGQPRQRGRLRS